MIKERTGNGVHIQTKIRPSSYLSLSDSLGLPMLDRFLDAAAKIKRFDTPELEFTFNPGIIPTLEDHLLYGVDIMDGMKTDPNLSAVNPKINWYESYGIFLMHDGGELLLKRGSDVALSSSEHSNQKMEQRRTRIEHLNFIFLTRDLPNEQKRQLREWFHRYEKSGYDPSNPSKECTDVEALLARFVNRASDIQYIRKNAVFKEDKEEGWVTNESRGGIALIVNRAKPLLSAFAESPEAQEQFLNFAAENIRIAAGINFQKEAEDAIASLSTKTNNGTSNFR